MQKSLRLVLLSCPNSAALRLALLSQQSAVEQNLEKLNVDSFKTFVSYIDRTSFQPDVSVQRADHDDDHTEYVLFLHLVCPYRLFNQGIKYGDNDFVREGPRRCMTIFQAAVLGKRRYPRRNDSFLALFDGETAGPEVADAVLTSALVNIQGRSDSFYPMDKFNEHVNLSARTGLRAFQL